MKNIFTYLIILSSLSVFAQKLKEIDSLNYEEMISKDFNKEFRNGMDIDIYKAIDHNSYKVGDTLEFGQPSGINTTETFNGVDTRFEYVLYGKPAGMLLKGIRYVEGNYRGYRTIIDKIQYNKGALGSENYVFFYVKPLENNDFTIIDEIITITMVDKAIERGEIFPLKIDRPWTREDAIDFLRKKKEELDLEIITQEEYDRIKNDMMPIIKTK